MFEKLTDRARRVVILSQEETRTLNHERIGSEHLFLGLLREGGGIAAQVLMSQGITLENARRQVAEFTGAGQAAPSGHIPFSQRANKLIQGSNDESLRRGLDYIGTEHLLLALIHQGDSGALQVLGKLGADPAWIARLTDELAAQYPAVRPQGNA
jgi:ATP-dependent Clp protease ATP-binding subunit ClpA